jgi:hypothetical protein
MVADTARVWPLVFSRRRPTAASPERSEGLLCWLAGRIRAPRGWIWHPLAMLDGGWPDPPARCTGLTATGGGFHSGGWGLARAPAAVATG